jgi:hypothetical protein
MCIIGPNTPLESRTRRPLQAIEVVLSSGRGRIVLIGDKHCAKISRSKAALGRWYMQSKWSE